MSENVWDPSLYDSVHDFVWKRGLGILEFLRPTAGERVLDVGCGTGHLTRKIAESGVRVIGVDASADMIAKAREAYPNVEFAVMDVNDLQFDEPFDAIFSNAALHWVLTPEQALRSMRKVLRKGGRLVLEMGGKGNVSTVLNGILKTLDEMGLGDHEVKDFLYFPSISEYSTLLESNGFEVQYARLFDRPTPLADGSNGLRNWVRMFKSRYLEIVPDNRHEEFFEKLELKCKSLRNHGYWAMDYRRLQVNAAAL